MLKSVQKKKYLDFDTINIKLFHEIMNTSNYELLGYGKKSYKIWGSIFTEYMNFFGLSKQYKRFIELNIEATKHYRDYVITGNRFLITKAEIKEELAKDIIESNKTDNMINDPYIVAASLSDNMNGMPIDLDKISAKKFYSLIIHVTKKNEAIKEAKKEQKNGRRNNKK